MQYSNHQNFFNSHLQSLNLQQLDVQQAQKHYHLQIPLQVKQKQILFSIWSWDVGIAG